MKDLVTVFGGSGFLGRHIVRALARRGRRVRVAVRGPGAAYRLPLMGDVGQIQIVQANIRDDDSVARALEGAEACVNAVGVLWEAGRQTFAGLHAEGAGRVAAAAARAGANRLAHISAIGADASAKAAYARSKAEGEAATRSAFPGATILRPSVVFGPEDAFFNRFAAMASGFPAVLPLIGGGKTRLQPVFVGDVAAAVAAALEAPEAAGRAYELGGPGIYSFEALMRLILQVTGRRAALIPLPFGVAELIGRFGDLAGRTGLIAPPLTRDQVLMLQTDNVVARGALGLADLGVEATSVESVVPSYLYRYRPGGQYADEFRAALPATQA